MKNFTRKSDHLLIPIALAALAILVFATPSFASGNKSINIVGQGIIWGGPNTYVVSTLRFDSGPIFIKPGTTIALTDNTADPHTFTLVTSGVEPHSGPAVDMCLGAAEVCGPAEGPLGSGTTNYVVGGNPSGTGYQCTTLGTACTLSAKFSSTTTPNGDEVLIAPYTTLYLTIAPTATPGTIIHFMCVFHPWMQGEFIVT